MGKLAIILIGFKGCGKTTLAEAYQAKYGGAMLDTDAMLCEQHGANHTRELYREWGETLFREREAEMVQSIEIDKPTVIATGGGVVMDEISTQYLKALGPQVYLRCGLPSLEHRLYKQDVAIFDTQPITELFALRAHRYAEVADICLDADDLDFNRLLPQLRVIHSSK